MYSIKEYINLIYNDTLKQIHYERIINVIVKELLIMNQRFQLYQRYLIRISI
jgi:hypothetical protein